ncbi:MAG: DUF1295 domain-containing protein [Chitinophagales bacterium]|nr:DUF1295 domain-containing protein [Chitinophagales bacterium]
MNNKYGLTASFIICTFVYLIAITVAGGFLLFYEGNLNPLWKGLIADLIATIVVFGFSYLFKNSSLYDPYWSVAPPLLAWYWFHAGSYNFVQEAMFWCIMLWAIRLTLNWVRGWHGLKHEDWRYIMLHDKNPKLYWFTSFAGIHMFPTVMVFLGMLPVYFTAKYIDTYKECEGFCFNGSLLALGALITVGATLIELIADEQMRRFKKRAKPGEFINEGLWKYSRHPNYFGEIAFWFGLWVMQMSIEPIWWTAIGFIAMFIMFRFASIPMMEQKNLASKSGYANYMERVSMLVPWFTKGT